MLPSSCAGGWRVSELAQSASVIGHAAIAALAVIVTTILGLIFGPVLEERFFPVVTDHEISYLIKDDRIFRHQTFDKNRNCVALYRVIQLIDRNGGHQLHFQVPVARTTKGRRRKLTSSARLTFDPVVPLRIEGTIWYRCHALWLTPHRYPGYRSGRDGRIVRAQE